MEKREIHEGFELSWQDPPSTTAGWTINIASENFARMRILHLAEGVRGGAKVIDGRTLEDALAEAKAFIDRLMGKKRRFK